MPRKPDPKRSLMRQTKAQLVDELLALRARSKSAERDGNAGGHADADQTDALSRTIFDGVQEAIIVIDPFDGHIVNFNPSAQALLQYSAKELLTLEIFDLHPLETKKLRDFAREVLGCGAKQWDDFTLRTKSGAEVPVEMVASRIETADHPLIVVIARDITERKLSEEALAEKTALLELVLDTVDQGISMVDADLVGVVLNRRLVELFDFPPGLAKPGTPFEAIMRYNAERGEYGPGDPDEQVRERVALAKRFQPHCIERARPDGTVMEIRGNPVPGGGFVTTYTDITERKNAENALRDSEERYRRLVEATPEAIVIHCDNRIVFVNPAGIKLFGAESGDQLLGRDAFDFIHPDNHATARARVRQIVHEGKGAKVTEFKLLRLDGSPFDAELAGIPFFHQGRPAVQAVIRDITERKRAEEQRRRAEMLLHDAIESIGEGFVLFDENDRVVIWNHRFAELYPELESMLPNSPTAEEMFRARYEAGAVGDFDVPVDEYVNWRMEQRRKQGGAPAVHRHSDGRWFQTTERRTRDGAIVAISTDITELKMVQTRLMDAIESIGEGFAYYDTESRLIFCNENYRNNWPRMREQIVPGLRFMEIAAMAWDHGYVQGTDMDKRSWLSLRADQSSQSASIVRQMTSDKWIRMNQHTTQDGGFVQTVTDISESVKAEAELRAAKDQAEFANRTKTEFLANMSHELRTPLNAINGFSEIMSGEMFGALGDTRYLNYAKDINDSGTHLLSLINDILDLAKIEAGKLELDERPVDIAATIRTCLRIVKERANECRLKIADRVPEGLPPLMADQRAIKQIVINILSNAVKFTPPGGSITVSAGLAEDGRFMLDIADTGIGIAAKDIPTAMTPFGQVDGSLSRKHQGTGLGLPLVKSLIELHEATIEIVSEEGKGTCLVMRFPPSRVIGHERPGTGTAGAA